jgi:hypothetical protein
MKELAYKIICQRNSEAIMLATCLEEVGITPDVREGGTLYLSHSALDMEEVDRNGIQSEIDDFCLMYELDYTPGIKLVLYDFEAI